MNRYHCGASAFGVRSSLLCRHVAHFHFDPIPHQQVNPCELLVAQPIGGALDLDEHDPPRGGIRRSGLQQQ